MAKNGARNARVTVKIFLNILLDIQQKLYHQVKPVINIYRNKEFELS